MIVHAGTKMTQGMLISSPDRAMARMVLSGEAAHGRSGHSVIHGNSRRPVMSGGATGG
jgi:hypothetical protein